MTLQNETQNEISMFFEKSEHRTFPIYKVMHICVKLTFFGVKTGWNCLHIEGHAHEGREMGPSFMKIHWFFPWNYYIVKT